VMSFTDDFEQNVLRIKIDFLNCTLKQFFPETPIGTRFHFSFERSKRVLLAFLEEEDSAACR
jgi:hypothetical protein